MLPEVFQLFLGARIKNHLSVTKTGISGYFLFALQDYSSCRILGNFTLQWSGEVVSYVKDILNKCVDNLH